MTETYNPMLNRRRVSIRQILRPIQIPPENLAYVYVRNGIITAVEPGNLYSWKINDTRYDIDLSSHTISFECTLPSNHDAVDFRADIQLMCHVVDPQIIVQHRITDACAAIQPPLIRLMRLTSRAFDVSMAKRSNAESAVTVAILKRPKWCGFEITEALVRLGLDQEELEHQRKLRQVARDLEFHKEETNLKKQREHVEQEQREQTVEFYNKLVQEGSGRLVFLHLAQHPEEARDIAQLLVQLKQADQKHWLDALVKLKESDILEEHHVKEMIDFILQQFTNRQLQEQLFEEIPNKTNGQRTP